MPKGIRTRGLYASRKQILVHYHLWRLHGHETSRDEKTSLPRVSRQSQDKVSSYLVSCPCIHLSHHQLYPAGDYRRTNWREERIRRPGLHWPGLGEACFDYWSEEINYCTGNDPNFLLDMNDAWDKNGDSGIIYRFKTNSQHRSDKQHFRVTVRSRAYPSSQDIPFSKEPQRWLKTRLGSAGKWSSPHDPSQNSDTEIYWSASNTFSAKGLLWTTWCGPRPSADLIT